MKAKTKIKLIGALLAITMIVSMLGVFSLIAGALTADTGGVYKIATKQDLIDFAALVNSGETDANAVLTANIDLNEGYTFTFIPDTGLVEVKRETSVIAYLGTGAKGDISGTNTTFDTTASVEGELYADATDADADTIDIGLAEWIPIGRGSYKYIGTFDGQGYIVSGLYINSSDTSYDYAYGLFGHINGGTVKEVNFENSYVKGYSRVGGICGYALDGVISDCTNNGIVVGARSNIGGIVGRTLIDVSVTDCSNSGTVVGKIEAGGIAGVNWAEVKNCFNGGTVIATDEAFTSYAGGIAGDNYGAIEHCFNGGSVIGTARIGGISGANVETTITDCYNMGNITGGDSDTIGGIVGYNLDSDSDHVVSKVENCYNMGIIIGGVDANIGGITGDGLSGDIVNCYYLDTSVSGGNGCGAAFDKDAFASGKVAYLLGDAFGQDITTGEGDTVTDPYPVFRAKDNSNQVVTRVECSGKMTFSNNYELGDVYEPHVYEKEGHNGYCDNCGAVQEATLTTDKYDLDGDGTMDEVYEIANAGQLNWFAAQVDKNSGELNAILTSNIDLNVGYTFTFIPDTGLVEIKKGETVVAYLGTGAKGNVSGTNTVFDTTASTTGQVYENADGTPGYNADFTNIKIWMPIGGGSGNKFMGIFDGNGKTVSGIYVNNSEYYQGLFGYVSGGTVKNVGVINSYVKARDYVGGVIGRNYEGQAINCYNIGIVVGTDALSYVGGIVGRNETYSEITNCYNNGIVVSTGIYSYVGGIAGYNVTYSKITNCYNSGNVSGDSDAYIGAIVGSNDSDVTNCYYLEGSADYAIEQNNASGTVVYSVSMSDMSSGRVAYLLGDAFGQTIGDDQYPVFRTKDNSNQVFYYREGLCSSIADKYSNEYKTNNVIHDDDHHSNSFVNVNGTYICAVEGCGVAATVSVTDNGETKYYVDIRTVADFADAGATVTLLTDVDLGNDTLSFTALDTVLDLNGKKLSNDGTVDMIYADIGFMLTIKDSVGGGSVDGNIDAVDTLNIIGGTFNGEVSISGGTISGGTFNGEVSISDGTISGGVFKGKVIIDDRSEIENGTFHGEVENNSKITGGTFYNKVTSNWVILGGTFHGDVTNTNNIMSGTFNANVENNATVLGGTFNGTLTNNLNIKNTTEDSIPTIVIGDNFKLINKGTLICDDHIDVTPANCLHGDICCLCGEYSQSGGHKPVFSAAVAPKCDAVGYTEGHYCEHCDEVLDGIEELDMIGHNAGSDGKCTECGIPATVNNGSKYYFSIAEAMAEAVAGDTVIALGDSDERFTVPVGVTFKGGDHSFTGSVTNKGTVDGGSFKASFFANHGTVLSGSFGGSFLNYEGGKVLGGSFTKNLFNYDGAELFGGSFAGRVFNYGGAAIYGGSFNIINLSKGSMLNNLAGDGYTFTVAEGARITDGGAIITCTDHIVTKSASCTEKAECRLCGEFGDYEHNYNEHGYCDCMVKITGASISIGKDLTMNYFVRITDEALLAQLDKLAMRFTIGGKSVTVALDPSKIDEDGDYVFPFTGIAPHQMTDNIKAELMLGDKVIASKDAYSVKENAESLLTLYPNDAKLVQLITDMLTYGAAAQNYKDHNTDDLANAGISGTPSEALPEQSDKVLTKSESETARFKTVTVWFDTVNRIGVKLSTLEGVTLKVNGEEVELTDLTYYTDAIYAYDLDKIYTFELYENGELVQTLKYSVSSYVYAMMNKTDENGQLTEMAELARALYRYGSSAKAYVTLIKQ